MKTDRGHRQHLVDMTIPSVTYHQPYFFLDNRIYINLLSSEIMEENVLGESPCILGDLDVL